MPENIDDDPRIDYASFAQGGKNTLFSYIYRDADNYKQAETVILTGALSVAQARALVDGTDGDDGFVPSAVGLEDLQDRTVNGWQSDVDHPFHEITLIELVDDKATTAQTAEELLAGFLSADWEAEAKRVEQKHAA